MKLTLVDLAHALDVSRSVLIDYEHGHARGHPGRSAAIPRKVELAVRYLEEHPEKLEITG